ncbi:unnamed protein product, partial [Symbiodinium sp. CCMP2456]
PCEAGTSGRAHGQVLPHRGRFLCLPPPGCVAEHVRVDRLPQLRGAPEDSLRAASHPEPLADSKPYHQALRLRAAGPFQGDAHSLRTSGGPKVGAASRAQGRRPKPRARTKSALGVLSSAVEQPARGAPGGSAGGGR